MYRVIGTSLLAILLLGFGLPLGTIAESDGPSASGHFQVSIESGRIRAIVFNARIASDGSTTGEIIFRDSVTLPPKGSVAVEGGEPLFYVKAVCDCLLVQGVEAVLSGVVKESTSEQYVGKRVLLVVQDGDSINPPLRDKLSWGFYRSQVRDWVPVDAERPDQSGSPTWIATDAERPDDVGGLSQKSEVIKCDSFPMSSHSFIGAKQGRGRIDVQR